jgi:hypothetical protein
MMKWVALVALALALPLWHSGPNVRIVLGFVISLAALLVAWQAVQATKYRWAACFYTIALLFNPLYALAPTSGLFTIAALLACLLAFGFSVAALRPQQLLTVPSVTYLNARRSSL